MQVLIIEDEQFAADKLIGLIRQYDDSIDILDQIDSVEEAVEYFSKRSPPDLLFLDIHLADGSSFEIFEQVEVRCPIIFTTAYDHYAIQAFKTKSVDYLLKPVRYGDLERALDKFREIFGDPSGQAAVPVNLGALAKLLRPREQPYKQRFLVKMGNTIKTIPVRDIAYFQTEDRATLVITNENRRYPVNYTLDELEPILDPVRFNRANRQFLISIESIQKIHPWFKSRLKLELIPAASADLVVSAEKTKGFKEWLDR